MRGLVRTHGRDSPPALQSSLSVRACLGHVAVGLDGANVQQDLVEAAQRADVVLWELKLGRQLRRAQRTAMF